MKTKLDCDTVYHIKMGLKLRIAELEKHQEVAQRLNIVETIPIWNVLLSEVRNALHIMENNYTFTAGE
jgi:hypothetical protein